MRIGIDLGGSKIEAAALDEAGNALARRRMPTPAGSYEGTLAALRGLVAGIEAELGRCCTVGVGIPGAISPATGLVKNANSTWLIGRPFERDLARVARAAGAPCQRRQLLCPQRGRGRCRPGLGSRLRRHPRHRGRRRHRGGRARAHWRQRHRRRVGPQPAPEPARRRATRPSLLLRPPRLRRDLPFRSRAEPRPRARDRRAARARRDRRRARSQAKVLPRRRWRATRSASRARLAW